MDRSGWVEGPGRRLIAALWGGWAIVAAAVVLLAGTAYLYAKTQPPVYRASGRVFLRTDVLVGTSGQDPGRLVATQADLASSTPVLRQVSKRSGVPLGEVQQRLTISTAQQSNYLVMTGTGATPEAVVELVAAAELAYQEVTSGEQEKNREATLDRLVEDRTSLEQQYADARAELAKAPTDPRLRARADILGQQLRTLSSQQSNIPTTQAPSIIQLVEAPQPPAAPVAPKPLWNGIVGGILGAVLGLGFVWWRSDKFAVAHQPAIAAEHLGIPMLGQIGPRHGRQALRLESAGSDPEIAQLALAVELAGRRQLGHHPGLLGLTYPDQPGSIPAGTVALASALASAGRQVVLADGIQQQPLIGTLVADGLLSPQQQDALRPQPLATGTESSLSVLPLGLDGRPGQMASAYAALTKAHSGGNLVVLVTATPNSPQAALLVGACEAYVLFVRPRTRLATLDSAKARLDYLDHPILGLVFERTRFMPFAWRRKRPAEHRRRSPAPAAFGLRERTLGLLGYAGPTPSEAVVADGGSNGRPRVRSQKAENGSVERASRDMVGATPQSWREYIEPRFDFRIAVPPEWKPVESREGAMVLYDPETDTLVSVEGADRRELSSEDSLWGYNENQYQGYERIKLESTVFKGLPALDWQFAHSEDGTRLRVTDLRLFVGDFFAYRISFQFPDALWQELRATLFGIRDSFSIRHHEVRIGGSPGRSGQ